MNGEGFDLAKKNEIINVWNSGDEDGAAALLKEHIKQP
jgi:hypothetical protein